MPNYSTYYGQTVYDPVKSYNAGFASEANSSPSYESPPPSGGYTGPEGSWSWVEEPKGSGNFRLKMTGSIAEKARQAASGVTPQSSSSQDVTLANGQLGVQVPYSNQVINPNDPNQRYQAVNIVKSPTIAAGEETLMDSFKKGATDSLKGFSDWLGTFKTSLSSAFTKSQEATDPTAAISTLQSRQTGYDTALGQAKTDYEALNQRTAEEQRGLVQEARDLIPEYDKAAQDAANQSLALLQRNVSRYKAASGTPMSLGSNEIQQLQAGAAQILVPMEQAKIQQRYNVLSNYAVPMALDIANREQQRIGVFNPEIAKQQFQSGQATAQTIQQLQVITAQMARQDAVAFLQAMAVPDQIQQQILSGQISQLGQLGQIDAMANYQGLQDVLGANPSQPQYYSMGTGGYPNAGRYSPSGGGGGGLTGRNAPIEVGPQGTATGSTGGASDWAWDANNQRWLNKFTGKTAGQSPAYQGNSGMPPNRYDELLGGYVNQDTGQVNWPGYEFQ